MFSRMLYNLFDLIAIGWTPADTVEDPILWHRRCFNEISDYIVNHTMDIKRSWYQRFQPPFEDYDIFRSNLLVHTDGGTRAGECSASAWYVEACIVQSGRELKFPLAMSGTYLEAPVSSFTAEAIALDESIEFVRKLLQDLWSRTGASHTKRRRVAGPFS